jgi:hypothetical protein
MDLLTATPHSFAPSLLRSGWLPALGFLYFAIGMIALGSVLVAVATNAFVAGIKVLLVRFGTIINPHWSRTSGQSRRAYGQDAPCCESLSNILESFSCPDAPHFVAAVRWKTDQTGYSWMLLQRDADGSLDFRIRSKSPWRGQGSNCLATPAKLLQTSPFRSGTRSADGMVRPCSCRNR